MGRAQFTQAELKAGVARMLAGRVQRYGDLDEADALAAFALVAHDGEITSAEASELATALQTHEGRYPRFTGLMQALVAQLLQATASPAPPAPAAPPHVSEDLDPRLVGRWSYTRYLSAGTFSSTVNRVLVLAANGRFAEDGTASANLREVDSTGRWTGTTSAYSDGDPGERGGWSARGGVLRLDYDDDMYAEYRYEASGPRGDRRLLTTSAKGKQQFWVEF